MTDSNTDCNTDSNIDPLYYVGYTRHWVFGRFAYVFSNFEALENYMKEVVHVRDPAIRQSHELTEELIENFGWKQFNTQEEAQQFADEYKKKLD